MRIMLCSTVAAWLISLWWVVGAWRVAGLIGKLQRALAAAAFACLGLLLAGLLLLLHLFHAFAGETLVASVTTRRLTAETFELTYTPAPGGSGAATLPLHPPTQGTPPVKAGGNGDRVPREARSGWNPTRQGGGIHMQLAGDQWSISGGIITWHPWLAALGLTSYHRPTRISGQYTALERQRAQPPTVYPIEPGADRIWEFCYRAAPALPFLEAVYGSSAFVYVEPGMVQDVYVTHSGYLIKRHSRPRMHPDANS